MKGQALKSRTLLMVAAGSFVVAWLLPENTAVTDVLISAAQLLGIITLVLGLIRLNRELKEKKQTAKV